LNYSSHTLDDEYDDPPETITTGSDASFEEKQKLVKYFLLGVADTLDPPTYMDLGSSSYREVEVSRANAIFGDTSLTIVKSHQLL
jgi:hypothetical protein